MNYISAQYLFEFVLQFMVHFVFTELVYYYFCMSIKNDLAGMVQIFDEEFTSAFWMHTF